ncbi:hypothetical protein OIU84_027494 [Salix udensis]|uniref:Pentatricopeptide repeat protein n=1 Tax=Salix udensis TaxID=889485 RepID=A0AAD6KHB4_9ROSI|nr:hypothetical protein OIU84_027494 [Salix udensis]
MDQARELLNEMQVRRVPPNSSTYDILICGWCNLSKQPELDRISKKTCRTEARTLFAEMNEKGFVPCENTLACISSTFARPGMPAFAAAIATLHCELLARKSSDKIAGIGLSS